MMFNSGCMGTRGLRDIINGGMTNSTTPSSGRLEGQHRSGTLTRVPRDNWQPNSRMKQDPQLCQMMYDKNFNTGAPIERTQTEFTGETLEFEQSHGDGW